MKVIDILNGDHKPFASFELVPPLKGSDINKLYSAIEPLMEFNPPFINMTAHREGDTLWPLSRFLRGAILSHSHAVHR